MLFRLPVIGFIDLPGGQFGDSWIVRSLKKPMMRLNSFYSLRRFRGKSLRVHKEEVKTPWFCFEHSQLTAQPNKAEEGSKNSKNGGKSSGVLALLYVL